MDTCSVWHWYRWDFGSWQKDFTGTKAECENWVRTHQTPGLKNPFIISVEKPTHSEALGSGAMGYNY